jgi:hypothetical protein
MSHLETVRVSLGVVGRRLAVRMGSSDVEAHGLLERRAGELRDALAALDFVVDDLRCVPATRDAPATQPGRPGGSSVPDTHLVDLRA